LYLRLCLRQSFKLAGWHSEVSTGQFDKEQFAFGVPSLQGARMHLQDCGGVR
jgi:hypothetical protein